MTLRMILGMVRKCFRQPTWKKIEYFDDAWKSRIRLMAGLIEEEKIVLDIGCGKMWLREYLSPSSTYLGCDYVARDKDTIVCDLNAREFPGVSADVCFVSGCFEYVEDPGWFVERLAACAPSLIVSYCTRELSPNLRTRKSLGWVNHLRKSELIALVESKGFAVAREGGEVDGNVILKFRARVS